MSQNNGLGPYASFDDWFHEQEGFGLRSERFDGNVEWLKSAFAAGRASPIQADGLEVMDRFRAFVARQGEENGEIDAADWSVCVDALTALSQAQSALAAMKGERDAFELQFEAQKGRSLTFLRQIQDELTPQLRTAEARIKALEKALREIQELNTTGADENGHRWSHSDLIEQAIFPLLPLSALSESNKP